MKDKDPRNKHVAQTRKQKVDGFIAIQPSRPGVQPGSASVVKGRVGLQPSWGGELPVTHITISRGWLLKSYLPFNAGARLLSSGSWLAVH